MSSMSSMKFCVSCGRTILRTCLPKASWSSPSCDGALTASSFSSKNASSSSSSNLLSPSLSSVTSSRTFPLVLLLCRPGSTNEPVIFQHLMNHVEALSPGAGATLLLGLLGDSTSSKSAIVMPGDCTDTRGISLQFRGTDLVANSDGSLKYPQ